MEDLFRGRLRLQGVAKADTEDGDEEVIGMGQRLPLGSHGSPASYPEQGTRMDKPLQFQSAAVTTVVFHRAIEQSLVRRASSSIPRRGWFVGLTFPPPPARQIRGSRKRYIQLSSEVTTVPVRVLLCIAFLTVPRSSSSLEAVDLLPIWEE